MNRITELEVFCGLGLNLLIIAAVTLIGTFAYKI